MCDCPSSCKASAVHSLAHSSKHNDIQRAQLMVPTHDLLLHLGSHREMRTSFLQLNSWRLTISFCSGFPDLAGLPLETPICFVRGLMHWCQTMSECSSTGSCAKQCCSWLLDILPVMSAAACTSLRIISFSLQKQAEGASCWAWCTFPQMALHFFRMCCHPLSLYARSDHRHQVFCFGTVQCLPGAVAVSNNPLQRLGMRRCSSPRSLILLVG